MPTALINGISGQDGFYLAEILLSKGYTVHGTSRSAQSTRSHPNLALCAHPLTLHSLEISDTASLTALIRNTPFDEIYHLAAQTHSLPASRIPSEPARPTSSEPPHCWKPSESTSPRHASSTPPPA